MFNSDSQWESWVMMLLTHLQTHGHSLLCIVKDKLAFSDIHIYIIHKDKSSSHITVFWIMVQYCFVKDSSAIYIIHLLFHFLILMQQICTQLNTHYFFIDHHITEKYTVNKLSSTKTDIIHFLNQAPIKICCLGILKRF